MADLAPQQAPQQVLEQVPQQALQQEELRQPLPKHYTRKPKPKDPRYSGFETISPDVRKCLNTAAQEIGVDCCLFGQTTHENIERGLQKPSLVRCKLNGEQMGYLICHAPTKDTLRNDLTGVGSTKGFVTFTPDALTQFFELQSPICKTWGPLSADMLAGSVKSSPSPTPNDSADDTPTPNAPHMNGPDSNNSNREGTFVNGATMANPGINDHVNNPNINNHNVFANPINGHHGNSNFVNHSSMKSPRLNCHNVANLSIGSHNNSYNMNNSNINNHNIDNHNIDNHNIDNNNIDNNNIDNHNINNHNIDNHTALAIPINGHRGNSALVYCSSTNNSSTGSPNMANLSIGSHEINSSNMDSPHGNGSFFNNPQMAGTNINGPNWHNPGLNGLTKDVHNGNALGIHDPISQPFENKSLPEVVNVPAHVSDSEDVDAPHELVDENVDAPRELVDEAFEEPHEFRDAIEAYDAYESDRLEFEPVLLWLQQQDTEQPEETSAANQNLHGTERLRLPLINSKSTAFVKRASLASHIFGHRNRELDCPKDVHSSSTPGLLYSSPIAQASNRQQKKLPVPYTTSQNVPVQHVFSKSPIMTAPRSLSSSSTWNASSSKVTPSPRLPLSLKPPMANDILLINPKDKIPSRFHAIFPYEIFNAMQSKCFDSVFMTDDNVVVSAPTGSGKTVLFELAICKLANQKDNDNSKVVYIAPTKALCKERAEQWRKKFSMVTMPVSELTGDTSRAEMKSVREAKIIVTTPEKWDSITRSWVDHRRLLNLVELFLIDEVHILKESRGATLEAVVSRMKTYGSKVRFIALSATVPNSVDIALWLGRDFANSSIPARREIFGEEFRPVKLRKIVHGFDARLSDHAFDTYLNTQLWKYIEMHSQRKPTLVFCMTRKSCLSAAEELAKQWSQRQPGMRLWPQPGKRIPVIDTSLQELVRYGVAFHHAGLEPDDRKAIHQAFEEGHLSVICCTSTLAVGVNLPCHTVVLKGTVSYQDGGRICEYSDLEVMQMLGRAGRPQYEKSALAIILTRSRNKKRYEDLDSGEQVLESTLHKNLIEHLNSEISLGTFQDTKGAKVWLKGTFLSVRLHQNPRHYGDLTGGAVSPGTRGSEKAEVQLEEICEAAIASLRDVCLIQGDARFQHTDYGRAMSKYMICFETMKKILEIPRGARTQDLLNALCEAREFNEIRWQASERELFRDINGDPFIMYPIEGTVSTVAQKVSLLIQMELGRVELTNINGFERKRLHAETRRVLDMMHRLIRTVIECKGSDADGPACWAALELARSMTAKAWEGRPMQLLQVPHLGPALMRKLVSHNIRTVTQLADSDPGNIERIASRNPPFGKKMADSLAFFPRLTLVTTVKDSKVDPAGNPVIHIDGLLGFSNARGKWQDKKPIVTFMAVTTEGVSSHFCRESLNAFDLDRNTHQIHFTWKPNSFQETLTCLFACEEIVGTVVSTEVRHILPASAFPLRVNKSRALPSDKPKSPLQHQMPSDCLAFEDEIDDGDMLEILDAIASKGVSLKRDEIEADVTDDDFFERLNGKGKGKLKKKPTQTMIVTQRRGAASVADQDSLHLDESVSSSSAIQQNGGVNTKKHFPRPPKSRHHGDSLQVHDGGVEDEPVRLANGRYKCGHPCSQVGGGTTVRGDKCGHDCCRIGSKHPPKKHNNSGKRKEQSGDGPESGTKSVPNFSLSSPPAKRPRMNNGTKSKEKPSALSSFPSPSQPRLLQRTSVLDLSLCDVDEDGIIDLTCDFEPTSDIPPRTEALENSKSRRDSYKISAIKKSTKADDMLDGLSDDDLIDIGVALEPMRIGKRASSPDKTINNNDYLDESTSSMLLSTMHDKTNHDFRVGPKRMTNRTSNREQERILDAARYGKSASMGQPQMADKSVFELSSPAVLSSDGTISNDRGGCDKRGSFGPVGPWVAGLKTQHVIETSSSMNRANDSVDGRPKGHSVVSESMTTQPMGGSEPEWVDEFDPALIAEFRGFVDFI